MADEQTQAPSQPVEEKQPTEQAPQPKGTEDISQETWKSLVGNKYKSPEELAKAYTDLRRSWVHRAKRYGKLKSLQKL